MIFGRELNWYLKIIQKTLLIVSGIIVFTDFLSLLPLIGWIFSLTTGMIVRLIKLGSAGYLGYQTVKNYTGTQMQALTSGGLFGFGVGLASVATNVLKALLRPRLTSLFFNSFWLILTVSSETVTGLILGFIGGIIAANTNSKK